jgi:hypothetical protein
MPRGAVMNRATLSKPQVVVYRVTCGSLVRMYYTRHHAEQMQRALAMHPPLASAGVVPRVDVIRLPDDPLTLLSVTA